MKTEHILIIRFSALGDVAMMVPVVASLARQYPHVRITVLSRAFARCFFERLAPNVGFMEADLKVEYHGVRGLNALYRRLVAKQFTAIADLHDVLRSKYLRMRFDLDRYKVAHIDKHRQERRQLCSARNKVLRQLPTSFENYAEVFAKLGYPVKLDFQSLDAQTFAPEDRAAAEALLQQVPASAQLVGVAPFAAHEGKVYPLSLMERTVKQLLERHEHMHLFFFGGGQQELDVFHRWCEENPRCTTVADHLSGFRQELALMGRLSLMLSMDSGNMHLASLMGIPVVSVWGATHPYAGFMGWNQREENIVQIALDCRPCSIYGNKPCMRGDLACMKNISPELIINKVENILLTLKQKAL